MAKMNAFELKKQIQQLIEEHGDMDIVISPPPDDEKKLRIKRKAYKVFKTPEGRDLLNEFLELYVLDKAWMPGALKGFGEFRAGQNDVVLDIRNAVMLGDAGKLGEEGEE